MGSVGQLRDAWLHCLGVETREVRAEEAYQRYGRALITAIREVLEEVDEEHGEVVFRLTCARSRPISRPSSKCMMRGGRG
jgi:hypothetical protein